MLIFSFSNILRYKYEVIFFSCLIIHGLFALLFPASGYDLCGDSYTYIQNADKVTHGNFDFEEPSFIRSPFYSILIGIIKILTPAYWEFVLITFQLLISATTGIYLAKISGKIFPYQNTGLITGLLFAVYIPTFYYVHSYSTEILYQGLFVAGLYFFIESINKYDLISVLKWAFCFTICYLTRSQIGLFFPFIPFILWFYYKNQKKQLISILIVFSFVFAILTFPWGIFNLKKHNSYITSSNGGSYHFFVSNSDIGFMDASNTPPIGSTDMENLQKMRFGKLIGPVYDSVLALPTLEKQKVFLKMSLDWIKENPAKFIKLKMFNAFRFLIPGVSWKHYPFKTWLFSFFISLPVYLLFYFGLYKCLKTNYKNHLWFLGWWLSNATFLLLFLFTQRYRTYGVEALFLPYCAYSLSLLAKRLGYRGIGVSGSNGLL
ncbi:MAG: hypothetical protein A3G23_04250 [Bacteroidetes bacterium RIFCSPLOWO2_12_FULL_37_12]|nr:MAG: hypothetical protein A3G23_04250 [Bacteroidetes bacterium RIFCSPLOWO2_12_FULL_37_12]